MTERNFFVELLLTVALNGAKNCYSFVVDLVVAQY